ncbi:MAG: MliC family protein [Geminicoccaceae bacterium]
MRLALCTLAVMFLAAANAAHAAEPRTVTYTCEDGSKVAMTFSEDFETIELRFDKALPPSRSASGAKYEADGVLAWGKGPELMFEVSRRNCMLDE